MVNNLAKVLILPERKTALQKIFINAFFYAAGLVFLLVVLLALVFPEFFLLLVFRHYSKLFIPETVAYFFFLKTIFSLLAMFLLALGSYFFMAALTLRQKEIGVALSPEGITSHYGRLSRFVPWGSYGDVMLTTNPLLIAFKAKKRLLVFDVFELGKLRKRIAQYRKDLPSGTEKKQDVKVVAAGIIKKDGKFLIAKRKSGGSAGGKWEFPGGKLEEGENPKECLARELKEELGIEAKVGNFFEESFCNFYNGSFRIMTYDVEIFTGEPQLHEHDELQWVLPHEMGGFDFVEGDLPIIRKLLETTV